LINRGGRDLYQRQANRLADGEAGGIEVAESAGTDELDDGQGRQDRGLSPALRAPQAGRVIEPLALVVDGVEPEDEALLLDAELPRLAGVLAVRLD
jgi:hypothetical protein